jgi:hypothetical protein
MSKGSRPRPLSIPVDEYNNRLDAIFGQKPKKEQYVPPPLPEEVKQESKVIWDSSALNAYDDERLVSKFDKEQQ